ncbi:protein kinase domain-containing protein [Coleofasciculus sp.]|uniref:protein kinase domain-containing protein n=1 Tax=Coleofasciculus sp. TaxID=3100458 RepID=UPI003A4644AC
MSAKVILTVITGSLKGENFEFSDRTTCILGRAKDCHPRLPNDRYHKTISRYHCLLDINPPDIRIRDFGSLHGTYVNGKIIGKRHRHQTPTEGARIQFPEYDLKDGDEIKLRNTILRVKIEGENNGDLESSRSPRSGIHLTTLGCDSYLPKIRGYTTLKRLGQGGLGTVYLAHHDQTGELVALKIMRSHHRRSSDAIRQFLLEVEQTKALQHPNIVRLRELGYDKDSFFFTMDYCNGGSVLDLMQQRGGKLSVNEAMSITLQVLDGLDYAHSIQSPDITLAKNNNTQVQGLVHRDLKPGNIFLANLGLGRLAKVADYGLAKAFDLAGLSGLSRSGQYAGSPAFMPRQQVLDFKYAKPDVDVWAIAACLYYILTGRLPRNFGNQDPFWVVLQTQPVPIRERDALIPKGLAEVIDLALTDNPQIYFKSAAAFKRALESEL